MPKENVLLFSGGIDSFCARCCLLNRGYDLDYAYFDLCTPYTAKERKYVQKVEPSIVFDDSLKFLGSTQVGTKAFVPYRNIFLAMRAASMGWKKIWIAGVKDDQVNDKSDIAFRDFSAFLTRYSVDGQPVIVDSPFWGRTKAQVVRMMLDRGLVTSQELVDTVACYSELDTNYCGNCNCCFRKFIALRWNDIDIEFHNVQMMRDYYASCKAGKYDQDRGDATKSVLEAYAKEKDFSLE